MSKRKDPMELEEPYNPRRKRKLKRRRGGYGKPVAWKSFVHSFPTAIPDEVFVKLKYFTSIQLVAASTAGVYVFKGNSLYDPDHTGAGHQPYAFDQYSNFFKKYRVNACKIKFDLTFLDTAGTIWCVPTNETTAMSVALCGEVPYAKYYSAPTSVDSPRIQHYMTTKKIFGMQSINQDDLYSSATNADPSKVWYWHLGYSVYNLTTNANVWCNVQLTYYSTFFERLQLGQS